MLAYLVEFPWMDPIISPRALRLYDICLEYLKSVQASWKMVGSWVDTLAKLSEVHHRFASEGRAAHATTDHFSEFRARVLDFGSINTTQLDVNYPQNPREMYSSVRTRVAGDQNPSSMGPGTGPPLLPPPPQPPAAERTAQISSQYSNQYSMPENQPMQSIHEGSLMAFMQGNSWDFLNDDWLNCMIDPALAASAGQTGHAAPLESGQVV